MLVQDVVNARLTPQAVIANNYNLVHQLVASNPVAVDAAQMMQRAASHNFGGSMPSSLPQYQFPAQKAAFVAKKALTFGCTVPAPTSNEVSQWTLWIANVKGSLSQGAAAKPSMSRAQNRLWALMDDFKVVLTKSLLAEQLFRAFRVGRTAYAYTLTQSDLDADEATALYVAYLCARRNERRGFSLVGKDGTRDVILEQLLVALKASPTTRWDVVAAVQPSPSVLKRLSQEERGTWTSVWFGEMSDAAAVLQTLSESSAKGSGRGRSYRASAWYRNGTGFSASTRAENPIQARVSVMRGDNSWAWNTAARWYNTSRDNWLACLTSLNWLDLTNEVLPPKALRIMAADLVRWHISENGSSHPDRDVALRLPTPWEVLHGDVQCTAQDVEAAVVAAGLDPKASGWTVLRAARETEDSIPAPDMVFGVAVPHPALAALLRKSGIWSGPAKAEREAAKAATKAVSAFQTAPRDRGTYPLPQSVTDELRARFQF